MEKIYTPQQIAKIIKVNYRLILDEIAMGNLPAFQIGRQYRVFESNLLEYIKNKKVNAK